MKKALIFSGGWPGHEPAAVASLFSSELAKVGITADSVDSLEPLADAARLATYDLLVPNWTMGELTPEQSKGLVEAVRGGVGLGGIHGGAGDAFRGNLDYEWMVGGHFVGHPHVGTYDVTICDHDHPITQGVPATFAYDSEQYYLLVDPGIHVLATSLYVYEGRTCPMPIAWTKSWNGSRVFYSALGHKPAEFERCPAALDLTIRGLRWAARDL